MQEPHLGPCYITGRTSARQSLFLADLMPVWARFSFVFSNLIRTRCRSPFFEFPFDIDILALSLDRLAEHERIDADQFSINAQQRTASVSGINGSVGLEI